MLAETLVAHEHGMKQVRGRYRSLSALGWWLAFAGVALLPLLLARVGAQPGRGWLIELGAGLGLAGLGLLVVQAWTSGRQPFVARNFGADNMMHFHRHLGLFAVLMVLAHPLTLFIADPDYMNYLDPGADWIRATTLWAVLIALMLIAASSFFRQFLGLSYELWRALHGVLALVILAFGLGHALMVNHHLAPAWKQALLVVLVGSAIYLVLHSRLIRPLLNRRRPWKLVSVVPEQGDSWTLTFEPVDHEGLDFQPGQYAWFTLGDSPLALQQHPFTIACAAESRQVCFTANESGDFTSSLKKLEPGTLAWIEGPFGSFVPDPDPRVNLFLVAGGIGITPMMSMLRTFKNRGEKRRIVLIYCNPDLENTAFQEELKALEDDLDLDVIHVLEDPPDNWQGESGLADEQLLGRYLDRVEGEVQYMTCGPKPLMDQFESILRLRGVDWRRIYSERFEIV